MIDRAPSRPVATHSFLTLAALLALAACSPAPGGGSDGGTNPPADGGGDSGQVAQGVTYWRNIAPILNGNCTQCHGEGGIGPMALGTYAEARAVAPLIESETASHRMPPWMPSGDGCRPLQDTRVLTQEQLASIAAWVRAGTPEGNMADYVAPPARTTARPLPPNGDLVVQPTESYTPTTTDADDYHCFIMDPGLTAERDVVGIRVTPGNARIVHHMILFEVRQEALAELQRLDDSEPGPGYTCFGATRINPVFRAPAPGSTDLADFNQQMVTGWAPGGVPGYFPQNTGIRLKPGSRLVMQVHYNLTAQTRGMSDRTRVDLYLAPQGSGGGQALFLPQAQTTFNVPAGAGPEDPAATVVNTTPAQFPVRFFGAAPHMHIRGRSIRVDVRHANGVTECLVNIPRWNFHWQQGYWFSVPFRPTTAAGAQDRLILTCTYDNSEANQPIIDGVRQQPRALRWGEGTNDEMCLNFFYAAL